MKGVMLQLPEDIHKWIKKSKGDRSITDFILDTLRKFFEEVPE